jgi:hypothetical protein
MSDFVPYTQAEFTNNWLAASRKKIIPKKAIKILGVVSPVFRETSIKYDGTNAAADALTETIDYTISPDKAQIEITNGRGFDVFLTSATINGKLIYQYSGNGGALVHDSLRRDDDIRRNGEKLFEIGNEFIVTADQCARIADYWYRTLTTKYHIYTLTIPGTCAWYELGAWYDLLIGAAGICEAIDTTVSCLSVMCERSAGIIGTTVIQFEEVLDA